MKELLIINGKTMQNDCISIRIKNNEIIEVGKDLKINGYEELINLENHYYISPGWIDIHTHCYPKWELYYDDADEIGYKTGVTTVIDAGSCGNHQIDDFYEMTKTKITNVYCFINIASTGIFRQDELSDLNRINKNHIVESIHKYPEFIIGIKARMSASVVGNQGIKPLEKAIEIKNEIKKPLMVHCGSNPPDIKEILNLMDENTMLTHCFHGKENNFFNKDKIIYKEVYDAIDRGMYLDVGHGKESFHFETAKQAFNQKLKVDTISTDIYWYNRINGPVYDLATTINKMLYIGYTLEEVIEKVTIKPAEFLNLNKGQLKEGFDGELTIFEVINDEEKELVDSSGNKVVTTTWIKPIKVVTQNQIINI